MLEKKRIDLFEKVKRLIEFPDPAIIVDKLADYTLELEKENKELKSELEKFKTDIRVGDKVRSFDFAFKRQGIGMELSGPNAHYVEGVVTEIGPIAICEDDCDHYHIKVEKDIHKGVPSLNPRVGMTVYPPVADTITGYIERI